MAAKSWLGKKSGKHLASGKVETKNSNETIKDVIIGLRESFLCEKLYFYGGKGRRCGRKNPILELITAIHGWPRIMIVIAKKHLNFLLFRAALLGFLFYFSFLNIFAERSV